MTTACLQGFTHWGITMKILLQRVWKGKVEWNDLAPAEVWNTYQQWRSELNLLSMKHISRCYYPKGVQIASVEIHRFSDISELAYAGVLYTYDWCYGGIHATIVTAKTHIAPIKRVTILWLECVVPANWWIMSNKSFVSPLPISTCMFGLIATLSLTGLLETHAHHFKPFVGNCVSCTHCGCHTLQQVETYVKGSQNPADGASRG